MAKPKKPTYIVEFPLDASKDDIKEVRVRFSFLRQLYNTVLGELFVSLNSLKADPEYQATLIEYRKARKAEDKKAITRLKGVLRELDAKHQFTEAATHASVKKHLASCCFSNHLDSHTTQKIASRAFDTMSKWRFGIRGKPRFKSWKNAIRSAEGKSHACLRIIAGDERSPTRVEWKGQGTTKLSIPVRLSRKDKDGYEASALELIGKKEWKFCRILTKVVRGQTRLYVQVAFPGTAFVKARHRVKHEKAAGKRTGLDVGPSTIAAVSEANALLQRICPCIKEELKEIARLQRQQSRRLRLLNPDNFKPQQKRRGRKTVTTHKVIKGQRFKNISAAYIATANQIRELHRVIAAKRKQSHDILANEIVAMGNIVLTEKISYRAWQKIFGRSVGAYAPSALISTVKRKAEKAGGRLEEINTWTAKLSQYDHELDEYKKKSLSERVHLVGGKTPVQRDLYSAFLALCIDLKKHIVSRRDALVLWDSKTRHCLERAGMQLIQTARAEAMPQSLGASQLSKLTCAQSEQFA